MEQMDKIEEELLARAQAKRKSIAEKKAALALLGGTYSGSAYKTLEVDSAPNLSTPIEPEIIALPETPEEIEIEKEIEKLPREDREKMGYGLNILGFKVEKLKNDFFSNTFEIISKGFTDEKSSMARFTRQLRDSFKRDSEIAIKKADEVKNGVGKHGLSNAGMLVGNILKYGRILADVTGVSIANPLRYGMMGGMVMARTAEAGKEARLENESVIEKTRIQDVDRALDEAWAIYNNAPKSTDEDGFERVSAEELKKSYLMNMPEDIWRRLQNPSTANSFIQKILRKEIQLKMGFMLGDMDRIEKNDRLSFSEKQQKKEALTKKYESKMRDYDRILTEYGAVDELAALARHAQTLGKGIVLGMQIETAVISIERLWGAVSNTISSFYPHEVKVWHAEVGGSTPTHPSPGPRGSAPAISDRPPVVPLETHPVPHAESAPHSVESPPAAPNPSIHAETEAVTREAPLPVASDFREESITFTGGKGGVQGIVDLKAQISRDFPDLSKAPQSVQDFMNADATKEAIRLGFYNPGSPNESPIIQEGSILKFDQHGILHFGKPDAEGKISILEKHSGEVKGPTIGRDEALPKAPIQEHLPGHHEIASPESSESAETPTENPETPLHPVEEARRAVIEKMPAGREPGPIIRGFDERGLVNAYRTPIYDEYGRPAYSQIHGSRGELFSGNRGGFFPDISERDNLVLQTHPEFAENPFHLRGEMLIETYRISRENIQRIFPPERMINWQTLRGIKASNILEHESQDPFGAYLHKLRDLTGLKPKGGFLRRSETTEHYIARALQRAAQMGELSRARVF